MKNYEWYGDKYIKAVSDAKKMGLTKAAIVVQGAAVLDAPVLSGNLRNSITYKVESEDEARVGTNVEYAARQEFGFKGTDSLGRKYNQPAQPYLRPALDNNKSAIENMIKDAISKAVK